MKIWTRGAAAAVWLIVSAGSAGAEGPVLYELPPGWDDRAEGPGRRLTAPASAPGDLLTVALGTGPAAAGGEAAAVLTAWADADLAPSADRSRSPVVRRTEPPFTVLTLTRKVRDPELGDHERLYQLTTDGRATALAKVTARGAATLEAQGRSLLALLASVRPPAAPAPVPAAVRPPEVPRLPVPYGETPDRFPGDPLFLPSGRGRPLPAAGLAEAGPEGLWWTAGAPGTAATLVFFADGTLLRYYRPGGPLLADLAGMKAGPSAEDVGSWSLTKEGLTTRFGAQTRTSPYTAYRDVLGGFFRAGAQVYRPAGFLTAAALAGRWRSGGLAVDLGPDGQAAADPGTLDPSPLRGRWWAEGTLLVVVPEGGGARVVPAYTALPGQLVIGSRVYRKD